MSQIEGLDRFLAALADAGRKTEAEWRRRVEVTYGDDQVGYAVAVHEDLTRQHPPPGTTKWLENAAIALKEELGAAVAEMMTSGKPLDESLEAAGKRLLMEANKSCPVQTGALRDSGKVVVKG